MNDILFETLKLIVMVAIVVLTRYVVPWVKERVDAEKMSVVADWAKRAVLYAQQTMWSESGEERKAIVTKFLKEMLTEKNIAISEEQIDILIEAAVKEMKISENSGVTITNEIKSGDTTLAQLGRTE